MSHETKSKLMKLCLKAYGRKLEIIDGEGEGLRLQPLPCDVKSANPKAFDDCVYAHCGKRMYQCKIPVVFKESAYFDLMGIDGEIRYVRFANTKAITAALSDFDRGKPFPVGKAFIFPPVPEYKKLANIRIEKKRWRTSPLGKAFADVGSARDRVDTAKRRAENTQEDYDAVRRNAPPNSTKVKEAKLRAISAKADVETAQAKLRKAETRKAKITAARGPGSRHPKPRVFDPSTRNGAVGNYNFVNL